MLYDRETHNCRLYRDSSISPCLIFSTVSCGLSTCILTSWKVLAHIRGYSECKIAGTIRMHTVMIFFSGRSVVGVPLDALRFPGFEASRTGISEGIVKVCESKALLRGKTFQPGFSRVYRSMCRLKEGRGGAVKYRGEWRGTWYRALEGGDREGGKRKKSFQS